MEYNKILQQKYRLENQLEEADCKATIAEDEVHTHKEKNKKLSKEITKLMVLLNNSKGCQEALEKHINDKVALDNCGDMKDDYSVSVSVSKPQVSPTSRSFPGPP